MNRLSEQCRKLNVFKPRNNISDDKVSPINYSCSIRFQVFQDKYTLHNGTLIDGSASKEYFCKAGGRPKFNSWVGKIPWRRKWQPSPVFLPGKSCGQRNLAGYSYGVARVGYNLETKPPPPHNVWVILKFTKIFAIWNHMQLLCFIFCNLIQLLLLLLSRFSSVRLCVTPETAAHQAPLSLGFSRQEHWSGLPFPSPTSDWLFPVVLLTNTHQEICDSYLKKKMRTRALNQKHLIIQNPVPWSWNSFRFLRLHEIEWAFSECGVFYIKVGKKGWHKSKWQGPGENHRNFTLMQN